MNRPLSFSAVRPWLLITVILVLAAGLRFYRIDAQSFWNDEGNSARLAERSLKLIVEGARGDIHPPGYYLVLHYWRALLGQSEVALRALSSVSGLGLVLFTFLVARRLFNDDALGLVAAALVAIHPFAVYYAQEARMYAMAALWGMGSTWALVVWWKRFKTGRPKNGWPLVAYTLMSAAGLYTHYAFAFVLLAQNLTVAVWLWLDRVGTANRRRLLHWVFAQGGVIMLYLPWLPTAWHQVTSWSPPEETHQLSEAAVDIWRLLNFGQTIRSEVVMGGLIAAAFFAFASLFPPVDEHETIDEGSAYHLRWALLALLILVPAGLILGLGLYRAAYQKFLLVAVGPLSVLVARGMVGGWRVASGAGVWGDQNTVVGYRAIILLIVGLYLFDTGRSLSNLFFDENYARADYRAMARFIEEHGHPDDAIVLNAPNQWEVFTYYYPDDRHVFPLARQRPLDIAANEAELEQIIADHQRVFAIFWGDAESDPRRFIEGWLEAHTYKAEETWYGDVRLAVYAVPAELAEAPSVALDARFVLSEAAAEASIYLDGYDLQNEALAPGEILQVALFWRALEPISERYKVFVHLYAENGELVAQTDSEPGGALRPTNRWKPGERIADRYGVLIPSKTEAGTYALMVGLYDIADPTRRLKVISNGESVGDRLALAQFAVTGGALSGDKE